MRRLHNSLPDAVLLVLCIGLPFSGWPMTASGASCAALLTPIPDPPEPQPPYPPPPSEGERKETCRRTEGLVEAAKYGCLEEVRLLLAEDVSANSTSPEGETALIAAAHSGGVRILPLLLSAGADPMATFRGETALCHGAQSSLVVQVFLANDLVPHAAGTCALLARLSGQGSALVVKRVIEAGVSLEEEDGFGRTPVLVATMKRNYPVMHTLLQAGANVRVKYPGVEIPITHLSDAIGLCILVRFGADIEARDKRGMTTLIEAAHAGNEDVLEVAIAASAELDAQDGDGRTALMHSLAEGHVSAARLLLRAGAAVGVEDRLGRDALFYAGRAGLDGIRSDIRSFAR